MVCKTFAGGGSLTANGGATPSFSGGGGGGGRIAVWMQISNYTASATAAGGAGGTEAKSYGGTAGTIVWGQLPAPPRIADTAADAIDFFSATLNGMLISTGTAPTTVTAYWGLVDGGTDTGAWGHTKVLAGSPATGEALSLNVENLQPGTTYYYRFYAENAVGSAWAGSTVSFSTRAPLPIVANAVGGATAVTPLSATLSGVIVSTGTLATVASVYWGPSDGGTDPSAWAHTNHFAGFAPLGAISTTVALPTADVCYYYTFGAVNAAGTALAEPSSTFVAGAVTLVASDAVAYENGPESTAFFTVTRPATATNVALPVTYTVSGTAQNGVDYQLLSGVVILPVGAVSADIAIEAIMDAEVEDPETVILTLASGNYAIGSPASDTVTIYDVAPAATNVWTGTGNWSSYANWSDAMPPVAGQHAIIDGVMTLAQATPALASLTNNGTLVFTTSNAVLYAREITVNGTVTHTVNNDTYGSDGWSVDGQVWIICSNLTVRPGAAIDVTGKGWLGGTNNAHGRGPGGGLNAPGSYGIRMRGGGASYGGSGGLGEKDNGGAPGVCYGSDDDVLLPGSGGAAGRVDNANACGGGYVRIDACGTVRIDGTIRADGNTSADTGNEGGGGSGGGIRIACAALSGGGSLTAHGGGANLGGGGGGGRIALLATDSAGWNGKIQAKFGISTAQSQAPTIGTVYTTDNELMHSVVTDWHARFICPAGWNFASLTLDNSRVAFEPPGSALDVAGGILLTNASSLGVGRLGTAYRSEIVTGGDLAVAAGSALHVYAGVSNTVDGTGARVTVGGNLLLGGVDAIVSPYSNPTNGGSVMFNVGGNVTVAAGAKIDADAKGFTSDMGFGAGHYGAGGGYGGVGGSANFFRAGRPPAPYPGGLPYGSPEKPVLPGSGGGWDEKIDVPGGGLIWITVPNGTIAIHGSVTADGGGDVLRNGGGSGGGIYLTCKIFAGGGSLTANGGNTPNHSGGGGGGGRIAVWAKRFDHSLTPLVTGGAGASQNGTDGTVIWKTIPPSGTVLMLR